MPQEFRQLAESLDSMAASLEKRDRDLVEARDAANVGNQAKSDFLANMSHEIRTPMNAILGMTYLTRQSELTKQQRDYIDNIHSEAEKLLVTVNDILDFSKIEAGKLHIEHVPFDLPGVLAKTVATVRQEAEKKGIAFSAALPPEDSGVLLGDPFHLGQLLGNLLGNAIKITKRGPVHFACSLETPDQRGAVLHCRITDESGDMKAEELARLFEDRKGDAMVVEKGFSLNLVLAQRLLRLMQGEIESCSEDDGGTHFTFRLPFARSSDPASGEDAKSGASRGAAAPAAGASQSPADENEAGPDSLNGLRILLVEDNLINQQIAEDILSGFGASVHIASNGLEALDLLHMDSAAYDVVLMDLYMPELDGIAATKRIRMDSRLAHLPIIAMTAQAKGPEWEACLQAGMNDIAVKPIDVPSLLATIKKWTSGRP